jgi:hypothetical protein
MINKGIRIQNKEDIKIYFFGGKGKFILKSNKTGKWFMYKMTKPKDNDEIYYISVLLDGYYQYLGVIKIDDIDYIRTKKVKIDNNHESIKGIKWLLKQFKNDKKFPNDMEFYHMGICCCCGRTLTVKDNIELGIGPICFKNYGKKNKRIMRIVKIRELKKNIKNK